MSTQDKKPEIILATHNAHKAEEIEAILGNLYTVSTMSDHGITDEIIEDGLTIEENADIKTRFLKEKLGEENTAILMADDTGLFVDYLNGEPGVYSARYAGEDCSYEDNNVKLLENLKDVPEKDRGAHFSTSLSVILPDGEHFNVTSNIPGSIATETMGEDGFGYDPVFIEKTTGKTYAQMTPQEKNSHSHRYAALIEAKKLLDNWMNKQ